MNILAPFYFQAQHQPTALAICAPGTRFNIISYGRLALLANNIARRAQAAGVKPGETVAVLARDPIFHWALTLGLGRIGAVTFTVLEPTLPGDFPIDAVVTDSAGSFDGTRVVPVDEGWIEGDGEAPMIERQAPNAIARIIFTSGSTGQPKPVALAHDMIARRIQAFDVAFGRRVAMSARTFVDVSIAANIGYLWGIYMLSRGGALFMRGREAPETMQAFSLYKVQCMVGTPGTMVEFLDYYERSPAFACPFEAMLSVGSFLPPSLAERVRARMCSYLVSGYGATEGNPAAGALNHQVAHIPGGVGYVSPGMRVEAADTSGRALLVGTEGLIRLSGERCVTGYVGNPPGSELFFRDGCFYTGDIGRVTEDSVLVIAGREKNIIDLGGDKLNPEAIEAVMISCPGVVHAAAFGRPNALGIEEVWAAVVAGAAATPDAIRAHCLQRLPAERVPARIVRVEQLPRTPSGKVDRKRLNEIT